MELRVINIIKKEDVVQKINILPEIFNNTFNESLVHQIITSYLSNGRTLTLCTGFQCPFSNLSLCTESPIHHEHPAHPSFMPCLQVMNTQR